jgi:hypothetical protein
VEARGAVQNSVEFAATMDVDRPLLDVVPEKAG